MKDCDGSLSNGLYRRCVREPYVHCPEQRLQYPMLPEASTYTMQRG